MQGSMSSPKKGREISVRIVIVVLQAIAMVGGGILMAFLYTGGHIYRSPGGVAIGVAAIVLTYESIMVFLVYVNNINHRIRLLVDIILNFVMVGVLIIILVLVICLSLIFTRPSESNREPPSPLAIFEFVILPAIFIIAVCGIPFIVSALISWRTRSMISNSMHEESRELKYHSSPVDVNTSPPSTSDCLPASKDDGLQDSVVDKVG